MKRYLIMAAVALVTGAASAAQTTTLSQRQVRDPRLLEAILEANAADAETRIAAVETGPGVTLAAAKIIVGNAGGAAAAVALSGDATITTNGVLTIAANAIDNAKIDAAAAIAGSKLAAATQSELARAIAVSEVTQSVTLRGDATVQINGFDSAAIAEEALIRVWFSTTDLGAPDATSNTVAVTTGTVVQEVTANAHYLVLTGATGAAAINVTVAAAGNRFVMVEHGGRVTSQQLTIAVIE